MPQLVPNIFAATRYGLGLAWKVVVVVEMFGTSNGAGYQVMKSYQVFNMEGVIAWTVTFVIAMIVIEYGIINLAERRLTAWRPKLDVWRRCMAELLVQDAEKWFRREDGKPFKVIDRLSFEAREGCVTVLIGPSG